MNRIKQYQCECCVCYKDMVSYAHISPQGKDHFYEGEILHVPVCSKKCKELYKLSPLIYTPIKIFEDIRVWGRETFPDNTEAGILAHIKEELDELIENPSDSLEMADLVILLVQLADLHGIDLERAVSHKNDINRRRVWLPADEEGIIRHKKAT